MKIQILSDTHIEFGIREFDFTGCDVLVLAGDIHVGTKGFEWISELVTDIPVLYILGNHEYYKHSYPKLLHKLKDLSKGTNIHILENESFVIEDITFHCASLWTDFKMFGNPEVAGFYCQMRMNDYNYIRRDPSYSKLRSKDTSLWHIESLKWLKESLAATKTQKNIVVTHHAPSMKSVPEQYRKDVLSAGFASNLEEFILDHEPDLWVHGHIHTAADYMIGKTRVICNPHGYPNEGVEGYVDKMILEV